MVEELPDGRSEARMQPDLAESSLVCAETGDQYRGIQGATEGTADEGSRGFGRHVDNPIERRDFGDRDATISCI